MWYAFRLTEPVENALSSSDEYSLLPVTAPTYTLCRPIVSLFVFWNICFRTCIYTKIGYALIVYSSLSLMKSEKPARTTRCTNKDRTIDDDDHEERQLWLLMYIVPAHIRNDRTHFFFCLLLLLSFPVCSRNGSPAEQREENSGCGEEANTTYSLFFRVRARLCVCWLQPLFLKRVDVYLLRSPV